MGLNYVNLMSSKQIRFYVDDAKIYRISIHDMNAQYKYSFKNPIIIAASLFASSETLLFHLQV